MEGPSLVISTEELAQFVGKRVLEASGTAKLDIDDLSGKTLVAARS